MSFTPDRLLAALQGYAPPPRYRVALSGGLDSTVLLHALHRLRAQLDAPLAAIHVDHGLHGDSAAWAEHCRRLCRTLDIALDVREVEVERGGGQGLEAAARAARERVFSEILAPDECLLTAQHQEDQAETLLLQLLRGAGVRGLAAMPARRPLGAGWLARPLLDFGRTELEAYARVQDLRWVEDPSNRALDFDRNYLRHEVLPRLRARWSGAARSMARSARHCGDAAEAIDELARQDLAHCRTQAAHRLEIPALTSLPRTRQTEVLRAWIRGSGHPVPDQDRVDRVLDEVIPARPDAAPLVAWPGAELRRFRAQLWLVPPAPAHDPRQVLIWAEPRCLRLPADLGELRLLDDASHPLAAYCRAGRVSVRFRSDGLRCRSAETSTSKSLKKLFQEQAVPPWLRDRVPLVFLDDALVAVGDYLVCTTSLLSDREFTLFWSLQAPWR